MAAEITDCDACFPCSSCNFPRISEVSPRLVAPHFECGDFATVYDRTADAGAGPGLQIRSSTMAIPRKALTSHSGEPV